MLRMLVKQLKKFATPCYFFSNYPENHYINSSSTNDFQTTLKFLFAALGALMCPKSEEEQRSIYVVFRQFIQTIGPIGQELGLSLGNTCQSSDPVYLGCCYCQGIFPYMSHFLQNYSQEVAIQKLPN